MTKLPSAVQIAGHQIQVVYTNTLETDEAYGIYDNSALEIRIDPTIPFSLQKEVFWHEVIEAITTLTEMDIPHSQIQTMGLLLHQVYESIEFYTELDECVTVRL